MYLKEEFLQKALKMGILFTVVLVLADLLAFFFYPQTDIGKIFLATREQTPLTWVSSTVLLLIAFSSVTAYLKTRSYLWYFLSLTFLFFSIDDATYFHERFSAAIQEVSPGLAAFPAYSWVVLYLPLLVFGLSALFLLLWQQTSARQRKLLVAAALILLVSQGLDVVDGFVEKSDVLVFCIDPKCNATFTHLIRLSEEVLEIIGLGALAYLNICKNALLTRFDA